MEVARLKNSGTTVDGLSGVDGVTVPGTIFVRDSKASTGPRLTLTPTAWMTFLLYASGPTA